MFKSYKKLILWWKFRNLLLLELILSFTNIRQNLLVLDSLIVFGHLTISSLLAHFITESLIFAFIKLAIFLLILFKWIIAKFSNLVVKHILSKLFIDFHISDIRFYRILRTTILLFNNLSNFSIIHLWKMRLHVVIGTLVV